MGKLFDRVLLKLFKLPEGTEVVRKDFKWGIAGVSGKLFRVCGTVHTPLCDFPYTERNWHYKLCAVVFWRIKVLSFTAVNTLPGRVT